MDTVSQRFCGICDDPLLKGEPKSYLDNLVIHAQCDISDGDVCDEDGCAYQWQIHRGDHVV